ncbi:hypothetical protein KP509_25G057600 [Ceratopteris richardii]|nr:hypothetical protein KP509_25G057600 [Ceratopteris richardii]
MEPLEFIRSKVSIYSIGPMGLMLPSEKAVKGHRVSFWVEERECLDWLNAMPDSSVLYVAFGSLASLDYAQVKVIAEGLEASEQAFLWVIRSHDLPSKILPEGFIQRTKNRGLIISWAPQPEVLSHRAVGGFFTHCGWNSVTENLSLRALPMICWPQLAEQKLNRRFLVDKFQVALELEEEKGLVKKEELEKAIREIMQGDAGRELRERALKCKDRILSAVQEGGSSQMHLNDLVEDIKKLGSTGNDI